jgi:dihydroxyacetone kinase-like protein
VDTAFFTTWTDEIARMVAAEREHLTALDAAIGDADHGVNLDRGFAAARAAIEARPPATPGDALVLLGTTLIRKVGGASGPLYGTLFRQAGRTLGEAPVVTPADLANALDAGLRALRELGHAEEGDKTMIDALAPALRALRQAVEDGASGHRSYERAAHAAQEGARATAPLRARKGRASYLGERSTGHVDPGAVSAALIMEALHVTATGGA